MASDTTFKLIIGAIVTLLRGLQQSLSITVSVVRSGCVTKHFTALTSIIPGLTAHVTQCRKSTRIPEECWQLHQTREEEEAISGEDKVQPYNLPTLLWPTQGGANRFRSARSARPVTITLGGVQRVLKSDTRGWVGGIAECRYHPVRGLTLGARFKVLPFVMRSSRPV